MNKNTKGIQDGSVQAIQKMKNERRWLSCLLMGVFVLFLAGCVESKRSLVATAEGQAILPDNVFISNGRIGDENTFLLHRNRTVYNITKQNRMFSSVVFAPLKARKGYFIAQLTKRSGGYHQALVAVKGRKLISYVVDADELSKAFKLRGLQRSKNGATTFAMSRSALESLFQAAVGHPSTKTSVRTLYDISDTAQNRQAAKVADKLAVLEREHREKKAKEAARKKAARQQQGQQRQQASTTGSSGKWAYLPNGRYGRSKPQPLIIGRPDRFDGPGKAPVMAFRCGKNQPLISIHWSVGVRPIMDDGKKAFMGVDISFDQGKRQLLVFASSKDHKTLFEMRDIAKPMFSSSAAVLQFLRADYQRAIANWNARDLTKAMRRARYMTLHASDSSRRQMMARYKVSDFAKVIGNFPTRCQ